MLLQGRNSGFEKDDPLHGSKIIEISYKVNARMRNRIVSPLQMPRPERMGQQLVEGEARPHAVEAGDVDRRRAFGEFANALAAAAAGRA